MLYRQAALTITTLLFGILFLSGPAGAVRGTFEGARAATAAVYGGESVVEAAYSEDAVAGAVYDEESVAKATYDEETVAGAVYDQEAVTEAVYGQAEAVLGMAADTTGVGKVGDQFFLEVVLSNAINVGTIVFEVKFDPAVLRIVKDEEGNSVTANPEIYKPDPPFNNPYYRADTECSTRLDGFADGIDFGPEPVGLGKIRFELLKEAETQIIFSYHKLSTPPPPGGYPQPIPRQAQGCQLVFDFTPPLAESLIVPDEALAGSKVGITAGGSDNVGLNYFRIEYSADGGNWHLIGEGRPVRQEGELTWRADGEWDTAGLAPGSYHLRVVFRDPGGREVSLEGSCLLTGSVRGEVYLEGLPPGCDRSGIKVYLEGTGIQGFTDASGCYCLQGVPAGERRLVAVKPGFLVQAEKACVSAENPHPVVPVLLLPTGDITGDNVVDLDDVVVMRHDYGKPIQRSDLDRSGLVGIRDLVLLARNYTKTGATHILF